MQYSELVEYMHKFRMGYMTRLEMADYIDKWQRSLGRR